jgi:hypothetical protein
VVVVAVVAAMVAVLEFELVLVVSALVVLVAVPSTPTIARMRILLSTLVHCGCGTKRLAGQRWWLMRACEWVGWRVVRRWAAGNSKKLKKQPNLHSMLWPAKGVSAG